MDRSYLSTNAMYIHTFIHKVCARVITTGALTLSRLQSVLPSKPYSILTMDIQMISFEVYFTIRPIPKLFFCGYLCGTAGPLALSAIGNEFVYWF